MTNQQLPKYRIEYFFNHSKFGFSNSITVSAVNQKEARDKAKNEVGKCYGVEQVKKRFTFKDPICIA